MKRQKMKNSRSNYCISDWQDSIVAADGTHHIDESSRRSLYKARFDKVLSFHSPGLAAVCTEDQSFHIYPDGMPAYSARFDRTFGFYGGLAAAIMGESWFHIHPNATRAYKETWNWCGNFQQNRCVVRGGEDYYHIHKDGTKLPNGPNSYAGDFSEGAAVVRSRIDSLCRHINPAGRLVHKEAFFDLGVFHKGIATAKDEEGWFHIDRNGKDISAGKRYLVAEPFYNSQALVKTLDGETMVVNETGETTVKINSPDK